MPAKSKSQQRLFGMVHAYQKGELKGASDEVKDIAKSISKKDAEDFAETKHKGLPNKVKKTKRITEAQLRDIIAESIGRVLREGAFDNTDYESYVLVDDSCDAVIQNYTSGNGYDAKSDAIDDARQKARETRGGSFSVFGCVDGVYDDDSLVYCTSGDRNSWKF